MTQMITNKNWPQIFDSVVSAKKLQPIISYLMNEFYKIHDLYKEKFNFNLSLPTEHNYFEEFLNSKNLTIQEKQTIQGHFSKEVRLNEKIIELGCLIGNVISSQLERNITFMHMPPMARFAPPHNKHGMVPPHKDKDYNTHVENFLTAWVPLVDINPSVGGLRFYYPSSEVKPLETKNYDRSKWLPPLEVEGAPVRDINQLKIGDVVVFEEDVIHASLPNTSTIMRLSLDFRFFSTTTSSTKSTINIVTKEKYII